MSETMQTFNQLRIGERFRFYQGDREETPTGMRGVCRKVSLSAWEDEAGFDYEFPSLTLPRHGEGMLHTWVVPVEEGR